MNTIVKMILPAAVFVLASAGAVGTKVERDNASKKALTTEWIQINNNPNDCEEREVSCTPENIAPICTSDSDNKQVFRKNAAGQCSVQLYKLDDN
jgi:hypothetical protein